MQAGLGPPGKSIKNILGISACFCCLENSPLHFGEIAPIGIDFYVWRCGGTMVLWGRGSWVRIWPLTQWSWGIALLCNTVKPQRNLHYTQQQNYWKIFFLLCLSANKHQGRKKCSKFKLSEVDATCRGVHMILISKHI